MNNYKKKYYRWVLFGSKGKVIRYGLVNKKTDVKFNNFMPSSSAILVNLDTIESFINQYHFKCRFFYEKIEYDFTEFIEERLE